MIKLSLLSNGLGNSGFKAEVGAGIILKGLALTYEGISSKSEVLDIGSPTFCQKGSYKITPVVS